MLTQKRRGANTFMPTLSSHHLPPKEARIYMNKQAVNLFKRENHTPTQAPY